MSCLVRVGTGGPILRWLAIAGFLQPLFNSLGWLYVSQGRGTRHDALGCHPSSLIVSSFILGLRWGPVGVACAYALAFYLLIIPFSYWYAGRKGPVSTRDLFHLYRRGRFTFYSNCGVIRGCRSSISKLLECRAALAMPEYPPAIASLVIVLSTRIGRELLSELKTCLQPSLGSHERYRVQLLQTAAKSASNFLTRVGTTEQA